MGLVGFKTQRPYTKRGTRIIRYCSNVNKKMMMMIMMVQQGNDVEDDNQNQVVHTRIYRDKI